MQVIRAEPLGWCMGVRRAVQKAREALEGAQGGRVFSLGPLIHNKTALDSLAASGLEVLREDEIDKIRAEDIVVVRAHGAAPALKAALEARGCAVVDATCPRVAANQKIAARCAKRGRAVIFAGDRNHAEAVCMAGFAGKNFTLVQNAREAEALKITGPAALLSQTTFSPREFAAIALVLRAKCGGLEVTDTICPATKERLDSLEKSRGKAEGVLVIGGRDSANTKRLFLAARERFPKAALIESEREIPADFFGMEGVCITSGASAPDETIDEIEKALSRAPRARPHIEAAHDESF